MTDQEINYFLNGEGEMSEDSSRLYSMIAQYLEKLGHGSTAYIIGNEKNETIEGQYDGKYYYEKIDATGRETILLVSSIGNIKWWMKADELHLDIMEINPEHRGKGIGTYILQIFKTAGAMTQRKVTLRCDAIDLHKTMGIIPGKKHGPKIYKRFQAAIDKRIERLCKFYFENGFSPAPGTGICWEYTRFITPEYLEAITELAKYEMQSK